MSIEVVTAADMQKALIPAQGDESNVKAEDTKSASGQEPDENIEESEASETQEEESELSASDEADSNEEDQSKSDDKKPKRKSGFQRRVDKLTSKLSAKEQEAEYWKQEAMKRQGQTEKPAQDKPAQEASADGRPKSDDFGTHEEYVEALTEWKIDQREKKKEVETKQTQVKSEQEKKVQSYIDQVAAFSKAHDDFDEVLEEVNDIQISMAVQQLILESENGAELSYELAKNRDEYARICKLTPLAAARELGKFEAKIAKSSEPSSDIKKVTKAPPPIKPVGAKAGSVKKSINDPSLSQAEYEALRREQMAKKA